VFAIRVRAWIDERNYCRLVIGNHNVSRYAKTFITTSLLLSLERVAQRVRATAFECDSAQLSRRTTV
jgi:hypothetical protein